MAAYIKSRPLPMDSLPCSPQYPRSPRPIIWLLTMMAIPSISASLAPSDSAILSGALATGSGEIVNADPIPLSPPQERVVAFHDDNSSAIEYNPGVEETQQFHAITSSETACQDSTASPSVLVPRSETTDSFPKPFDTSLANNFTEDGCLKYFKKFLSDQSIVKCHAISLLLQDSTSFFHTLTSAPATSRILDEACAADVEQCSTIMEKTATKLISDNCAKDYSLRNPNVVNAYIDLITYEPIYRATCLKNPDTQDYCFVDAATNSSSPGDYDVYSMPYGTALTSAPYPTCNQCLQASMGIFSHWAQVDKQPLTRSYLPSANSVNSKCGSGFAEVNITVGNDTSSGALWSAGRPDVSLITLIVLSLVAVLVV